MAMRKPIVGGNWKMNTNLASAAALAEEVVAKTSNEAEQVEVVVFAPFPYLLKVGGLVAESKVALGAQDVYFEGDGAYTGEISVAMLKDVGCTWVLCGHSERRHVLGESDQLINQKVRASLAGGLKVILCIGETQAQREAGQTDAINIAQLEAGLADVTATVMGEIVIAYEPVWAIGTGLTASPADAQQAHAVIRNGVKALYGATVAESVRIQYGGSMKPGNAAELIGQSDIDGGLIGGAALKGDDFSQIVAAGCLATT